jgi:glycosyltransferase involved in cell wall biosynthesis
MGWRITLVSLDSSKANSIRDVSHRQLSCPDYYLINHVIFHLKFILLMIKEWHSVDVVLFHQKTLLWVLFLHLFRTLKCGIGPFFVMDTRTLPMEDKDKATWRDWLRGNFGLWMNKAANIWADGQTAITQRMADKINIPPRKLLGVWPSGADLGLFESAYTDRHWPKEDEPVCLHYIGVLHYERNLMTLCRAVEKANAKGMRFNLTLTGEGTERVELEKYSQTTSGRIRINKPVPHDHVAGILKEAHVGVLPFPDLPKYRVSSPIKFFEYLAAGLPVLATRIICHTDIVGEGDYVFWANEASIDGLTEALADIWEARSRLIELGKKAVNASRDWTWEEAARKLSYALKLGMIKRENCMPEYPYRKSE